MCLFLGLKVPTRSSERTTAQSSDGRGEAEIWIHKLLIFPSSLLIHKNCCVMCETVRLLSCKHADCKLICLENWQHLQKTFRFSLKRGSKRQSEVQRIHNLLNRLHDPNITHVSLKWKSFHALTVKLKNWLDVWSHDLSLCEFTHRNTTKELKMIWMHVVWTGSERKLLLFKLADLRRPGASLKLSHSHEQLQTPRQGVA